jgi:hypothetical protein
MSEFSKALASHSLDEGYAPTNPLPVPNLVDGTSSSGESDDSGASEESDVKSVEVNSGDEQESLNVGGGRDASPDASAGTSSVTPTPSPQLPVLAHLHRRRLPHPFQRFAL